MILIQESRSFDGLFHGYPGANYANFGFNSKGQKIALEPISYRARYEICDDYPTALRDIDNGKMDGFDLSCIRGQKVPPNPEYVYVNRAETRPYFEVARGYSLGDEFFASQLDSSFVAHQYLIAAQAGGAIGTPSGIPWGCDAPPGTLIETHRHVQRFPCFEYTTLGDELDRAKLSWRYYVPNDNDPDGFLSAYDAIADVREGHDWERDVISPQCRVISDAQAGHLPAVSWVVPSLADSDSPGTGGSTGPLWVTAVVNAIGKGPDWKSTVVFVTWDSWGGFYDHVPPPVVDWDGLGLRVPLIAVSAYSKAGSITHTTYDGFAAMLKSVESLYGLPSMTRRDRAAASLFDDAAIFDFNQKPRTFKPFDGGGYSCS